MKKRLKVAVTGAAGQIGYQLIFRIASGQMFGPQTELEFHLLEVEQALGSLRGTLMELEDCAFPLLKSVQYGSNADAAMRDVDWAILVGAVPRKGDMQRSDLLRVNGKIFTEQGRAIEANAADDVQNIRRRQSMQYELPDRDEQRAERPQGPFLRYDHARRTARTHATCEEGGRRRHRNLADDHLG